MALTLEDAAKVGGSDLSALLGRSPWGTPFTLYARIVAALEGRAMPHEDSTPKRRGRVLEKAVLDLYAEETESVLQPGPKLRHWRLPYVRASLDALTSKGGVVRVVDAKTAGLTEVRKWGEAGTDEVPEYMLYQLTLYAGLWASTAADVPRASDVAALVGGDLRVYRVPYDGELFGMLEVAVERFWKDHVEPRRPPPMTDPPAELPAIGALYPKHEGEAKDWGALSEADQQWFRTWLKARKERQTAEWAEKEAEARVRMLLGTTPQLTGIPGELGVKRIDFKQNKAGEATDWRTMTQDMGLALNVGPERYNEFLKRNTQPKEGARPLVVREAKEET